MHKQNARIRAHTHTHGGAHHHRCSYRPPISARSWGLSTSGEGDGGWEECAGSAPRPHVKVGVVKGRDVSISEREIVFQLTKPQTHLF